MDERIRECLNAQREGECLTLGLTLVPHGADTPTCQTMLRVHKACGITHGRNP